METFLRAAQARATDAEARAPAWWSHRLPASARSRSMELVLVGQQVSRLLPSSSQRQFRALWRELVVLTNEMELLQSAMPLVSQLSLTPSRCLYP